MTTAFQSNAFQNNAFQIDISNVFGGRRWKKDYEQFVRELHQPSDVIKQAATALAYARAKSLTSKQRSSIATIAANTRWKK